MQDMQEVAYPEEKKESVADQFAVKYRSEMYCWTQELNKEITGQASTSCCCKRVNTVEKQ